MLSMREAVLKKGTTDTYIMETFTNASPFITYARPGAEASNEEHEMAEIS